MTASSPQKAASRRKAASKPKSEPAPKTPVKPAKKSRNSNHPKFIEMIIDGLQKMNEKSGSSRQAILKFIVSNYPVDQKQANQYVKVALKNGVKSGLLKQLKGVGASGSFKLADKAAKAKRNAKPTLKLITEKKNGDQKSKVAKAKTTTKQASKKKTVTKEAAAVQLPSAPSKGRKPPTVREQVVAKKSRSKKPAAATSTKATAEEVAEPEAEKKVDSEKQVRVSARRAAEAKSKRAPVSTRGKKKDTETNESSQS